MGENAGIAAILRDVIRPRAAYAGRPAGDLPAVEAHLPGRARARRWSGCGSTGPRSGPTRPTCARLLPVEVGDLNRLYQLGFTAWLPPSADRRGRLLRDPGRTAGSCARPAPTSSRPRRAWAWSATS